MERPLHAILLEEQVKLFFNDLIQQIESIGFKQCNAHWEEEGRWMERLLHYRYKLPHGYTEIEIDTSDEKAFVTLHEYSPSASIETWHYMDVPVMKYGTQKVLKELDTKIKLVELF